MHFSKAVYRGDLNLWPIDIWSNVLPWSYNNPCLYVLFSLLLSYVSGTTIPIPTHYFAVLTSCRNSSQPISSCDQQLQTVSFLVPHRPDNSESCNVSLTGKWRDGGTEGRRDWDKERGCDREGKTLRCVESRMVDISICLLQIALLSIQMVIFWKFQKYIFFYLFLWFPIDW